MTFVLALALIVVIGIVFAVLTRAGVFRSGSSRGFGGLVIGLLALLAFSRAVTVIPAGHVGVVDLFGKVQPDTLKSGIQLVKIGRASCRERV